ncbi:MAG: hypothetical protein ACON3Z_14145 [Bradymonadia bacterium]
MAGKNRHEIDEISLALNAAGIGRNESMLKTITQFTQRVAALLRDTDKDLDVRLAQVTGQTGDNFWSAIAAKQSGRRPTWYDTKV